jgi:hypothetical protein
MAAARPPTPEATAITADPGAAAMVQSILGSLEPRLRGGDGCTRIDLSRLRNHSRAGMAEFEAFRARLALLLTEAGRPEAVIFTADVEPPPDPAPSDAEASVGVPAQYELLGAAYLVTADGFDQWELFPAVTAADRLWTLWQPPGPVRMLRHRPPGAGAAQIWFPSAPGR